MNGRRLLVVLILLICLGATFSWAQYRSGRSRVSRGYSPPDRGGTPRWDADPKFAKDVFTFLRVKYPSSSGWGWMDRWTIDYPDSDLNLSFRLQQMTSLKVDPDGKILELTDQEIFDYPFIYIVEPGFMSLTEDEVAALRRYLVNGGFLMVDDFWGEREWNGFYSQIKRVFPDREPIELEMSHPIFHCVFDLNVEKNKLQVPNIGRGVYSEYDHITWERPDAQDVHFKAIKDDKDRIMVMICHNTDNGDGWEREGESEYYFREFSEKKAYPLGINIIYYTMTH